MMKAAIVALVVVSTVCGCTQTPTEKPSAQAKAASALAIGMEFKDAERILEAHGAKEVIMAMAPPKSPNGGYMTLVNYEISGNRAITIVHDQKDGKNLIVKMTVCNTLENPKAMRGWETVEKIDVGNR
jgi:hypothetical protein